MPSPAIRTVHAVLAMATDMARTADDLNASLKANRGVIALLEREAPDLWAELRDRTRAKRAALMDPSSAPPPPPPPPKVQPKPPPLPPLTQYRLRL
ncbi:hypothetical protein [Azospirillum sp. B510]|uniref:hypothetical protein n=1 Tax=Azospirillum sp. (strain B510) TaxID=137722 RepID=UPI00030DAF84|nr:hypothetical protein [Azospirillum sp. B510]